MTGENTQIDVQPKSVPDPQLKARFKELYNTGVAIAEGTYEAQTPLEVGGRREIEHKKRVLAANVARELIGQEKIHDAKLKAAEKREIYDPLTGLLSLEGFNKRLALEIIRAKRDHKNIAIMLFDLNGLKEINDNLGHAIGDQRIIAAADVLASSFRPTDLVARRGTRADEFLVALEVVDLNQVQDYYQRVTENSKPLTEYWGGIPMILPAGATLLDFEDIDGSMHIADIEMYAAKEASKLSKQNTISLSLAHPGKTV
jgi:diguanylate cyclase (GGDEF)-like protein